MEWNTQSTLNYHLEWLMCSRAVHVFINPLTQDPIFNSPYCQPYNSCNVSSVLDQPIIPKSIFFIILITYLVDIVLIL